MTRSTKVTKKTCSTKKSDGYSKRTERFNGCIKREINELVSRNATTKSRCLVLDSESGNTSRHLSSKRVSAENIHVPNYSQSACEKLENLGYSTPYCATLTDHLGSLSSNSMDIVWFDYCGTWGESMQEDTVMLFKNGILASGGEFSLTSSMHGLALHDGVHNKLSDYGGTISDFIKSVGRINGYNVYPVTSFFYGIVGKGRKRVLAKRNPNSASMLFQMYKCEK